MLDHPSLLTRFMIGTGIGFLLGVVGFFWMPYVMPAADMMVQFGVLFWYTTLGFVIALVGVFNWKAVVKFSVPWWLRAPVTGAWLNFVLTLLTYNTMQNLLMSTYALGDTFTSPFWFVVEGAVVGLIIGFFATRYGGEKRIPVEQ
ncbi:hypothetical protein [Paremcibacter congregatus]|uniref:hypothetical protein n=1 Tax=Paremcibacter congregatus TaxID=2043170 RepID=UPI0030EF6591|tara:strand:- start:192 stop:626 length:435 start_codon:yes stop_codon:yes gene_type:complete